MLKLKVGDMAVYPAHGVGEIVSLETKEIAGNKIPFYVMRILDSDMTIMIPTKNVNSVGLREITSKNDVDEVFKILKEKKVQLDVQTWNRRFREYTRKIKTGSINEIAEVFRDLHILKKDKILSFGEKKMLESAKNLLKKELSIAKNIPEEDIEKELKKIFKSFK